MNISSVNHINRLTWRGRRTTFRTMRLLKRHRQTGERTSTARRYEGSPWAAAFTALRTHLV